MSLTATAPAVKDPVDRVPPIPKLTILGNAESLVDLRVYAASLAAGFVMSSNSTGVSFPRPR